MPCPCQNASSPSVNNQAPINNQNGFSVVSNYIFDENCPFTLSIIQEWFTKLINVKNSNTPDLYNLTYAEVNSYLGTLQSAINFSNNICFFRGELETIQTKVNVLP